MTGWMLTDDEVEKIRDELENCKKPFFFFHDDPDGLASFLLCYRWKGEGKGYPLKAIPRLTAQHATKVKEYGADKVFILDIAMADQEFFDELKGTTVVWLDHHDPQEREGCLYFNPRLRGVNIPTPVGCYQIVKQDLWLATIGSIGDWYLPPYAKDFHAHWPDLLPEPITTVEEALFNSPLYKLIMLFSFVLKGPTSEVMQGVKILTRIKNPHEIVNKETPQARWLVKKYEKVNQHYQQLMKSAEKNVSDDPILVFTYSEDRLSLTKDLANELLYKYNDKIIVLGRRKSGEVRCSLRSGPNTILTPIINKALKEVNGHGGGHEHAMGAAIPEQEFERFLDIIRAELQ
jgi:single-stranded DNA-specific DHH superfamily exonuclease